jgi:hypothetical protein
LDDALREILTAAVENVVLLGYDRLYLGGLTWLNQCWTVL